MRKRASTKRGGQGESVAITDLPVHVLFSEVGTYLCMCFLVKLGPTCACAL